ncbi:mucin-binding protein [Limosilactobacillus mucosae]
MVNGVTDQTVKVDSTVPAGWKLVDGQSVPTEITFKGAKTADVEVKVEHAHVTVTPDAPKTSTDKLPDNADKNYPNGVDHDDLNKTVKRTINVHNVDGTTTTVEQEVHFTRTADVDEANGTVAYGDWQADKQFDQYAVPVIPGYVSMIDGKKQTTIQPTMPSVDDKNSTIDVTYQAVDGSQTIDYVDENGTVISYQIITGKMAETKPVNSAVPTGWKLVDGQTVPETVTIKADNVPVKVLVEHDHVAVSHDNPQANGTKIPNGASVFNGVTDNDLNQTLTRTITVNDPHEGAKTVTQTAKISRNATVDMVDGSVVYGDWSTAQWPAYSVPTVDGYTPSQKTVEAKAVANGDKDDAVTINYTADKQVAKIVYTDENDNPVKTDTVKGVTDQIVDTNSTMPTGWKLVDGQTIPAAIKLGVNTPDTVVKVEHDHVSVSHDNPQTDGIDIPGGAAKFSGVADHDLNQTLTRTITVNDPHAGVKTVTQTAKIHRDATVDMVDGSVKYGDWSMAEWPEYSVPTVDGYTPSQKTVEAKAVVNGDKDDAVAIDYTADKQTAKIVYTDADDNPVKTDTVEGVTDQTVDANSTVPTGWKLVDGQTVPATIKLGVNTPDTIVKVEHDHVSISHDNPQTDGTDIPNGAAQFKGVSDSDLNQTLTRTITVNDPHEGVKTIIQTAQIHRDATVDMVDGSVVYGDWSTAQWPEYSVPTVDGYTPSQTTVEAKTVANGDQDDVVTIDYTADKQTAKIVYTDENDNPVKTDMVNGVTDQTVDANSTVPTGWKLVDGQTIPVTIKLGVNTPDTVVKVEHDHVSVSHDTPQTDGTDIPNGVAKFKGVSDSDLNQTLTRTITVSDPHAGAKTITQTAKIYRDATVDMVDGSVAYSDWSTAEWPEYSVPTVDGYTPSQKTVETKAVIDGTKDDNVTIDYTADKQTAKIVYTDENNQPVKTDTVNGVTDQTVDTNSTVPTGWKLVDGQMIPVTIKLSVNTPDTVVKVEHDHVSISHNNPQIDGTDIPNGVAKFKGVSDSDLNQTLTRMITVNDPHAGVKTITQTAKIYRDATVDMIDGSVAYSDWSTAEWPEYSAPTVDGYTPSQATVEAKAIADGDEDDNVTIDYTADKQTAKIVYTDADDNPVKTDTVDGVTDQTVDANSTVPTGWKLVDGQTIPVTIKLGVNTPDTIVKVEHDHVSVSHSNPQTDGTDIPNGVAKFKDVSDSDLNQTLTRTITVNDPHAGVRTITQTAKISRNATVDMVDGSVAYSDWSTAEWPEYSVPTVDGYTPSQKTVEAKTVANGDQDDNVMIDYTADQQTAKIVYTDENDNPVKTDTVDGVTDQTVDANSTVPIGWKLVDGQMIPTTIKLGVNTPDVIVKVEHNHVSVSHNNPQTDGTDIPGGTAKFNGVADNDLNQTLTRTITINDPHQGAKTITQTAKIYRDATVDMVDGSVKYGDWSTAEWPEYSVPTVDGYTPSQATVEAKTVTNGDQDDVATINYTADRQTAKIVYTDENDNPVKTDTVDGVTDQTVNANSTVPAGWKLIDGQTIPVTIKLGANTPATIVKVEHDHVSISHDNPQIDGTDIPGGAAKFSGVDDNDLNQTLTRTITINDPHDGVKTITQTAQIHRDATVDMVDGSVVYGDWSTTEWPEYSTPMVDGYTPSQATIEKKSVINGDQDDAVTIDYKANAQTAKIVYTDENDQPVKTDTVDGVTDQTVDTNSTVPTGWKLVDGQTIPVTIKLGVNTPDTVVKVEHDHVSISHDNPQSDGADIPNGTAKFKGVDNNDLNQTLTRTITINDPHEGVKTIAQTTKISRAATVDMVDGSVKYGDWSTAEWPEYSVPTVDGYTPNQKTVEAKTVVNGDQNDVVTIDYTADKQTANIVYVDKDNNTVKTDTVNGVTDQTVDTNSTVPTGWKLVDGQTIPTTIKLGANTPDTIVKVEHDHVSVSHDNPQTDGTDIPNGAAKFKGVSDSDLNQTITRTITVNDPHAGVKTITQTAKISRNATVDMVDGSVTYGDWSTAQWPEYSVPTVDGYTPSQAAVEKKSVTNGDKDDNVTINYTADKQTTHVVYVDENGNQIKSDAVDGRTDETVKVVSNVPAGWKLVDGQSVPTEITFKGAKTADVEVKVEHAHVTVTPDAPKTSTDKLPDNADKSYPNGVDHDDLNKTVKRTINVHNVDGTTTTVEQEVHFTRTADVDEADGTVVYGNWQADKQFDQYAVPVIPGYVSMIDGKEQTTIQPAMPNVDDNNSMIEVSYQAVDGSQTIDYVDENGTVISYQIITGKTAETKPVNSAVPTGWKLVDGQTVPDTVTIKVDDVPVKVSVEHDHAAVSHDNPQANGTEIPNGVSIFNGVTDNDLNQTLTRTITVNDPHEDAKTITQTAKISRDATVDMVDGSVKYGDWSTAQWPAYSVPAVDGYTPSQATVEAKTVTNGDQDDNVTIDYTADQQTAKIAYTDENDQPVKTDTVDGVTDQTVDTNSTVPTGWKLIDGQTVPATIKLGVNTPDTVVKVEHDHVSVSYDNPQTDGTDIPNGAAQFKGVSESDLNQTLTRTIAVNDPHEGVKTITQTAKIYRDATVDMVDGSVVYGDWSTAEWSEYVVPAVDGYTPSQKTVEAKAVVNGDKDDVVTINYTADKQMAKIVYTDESGQPVKTDTVNGVTDQTVDTNSTIPTGWKLVDGQTIPATIKLGVNTPDTKITVEHDHVMITPDNPQTDGTDIPNGAAQFKGVAKNNLNQTITRTIHVNDPYTGGSEITQTAQIHRDATVDMVDGSVVYGDWSTAEWPKYVVPTVDGYTPSQATVEKKSVTNGDKDETVTVDYLADPQTVQINYAYNGQVVKNDSLDGYTDEVVSFTPSVPTGYKLVDSSKVPSSITMTATPADVTIAVVHDHVVVTHDTPQTDGTQIPNGAAQFKGVSDSDLNQTITRTIHVNDPYTGGSEITQTAKISRDATVDMVDGSVVYGDWSTAQWPEYSVPTVDSYTPSQATVEAKTVDHGDKDDNVTIDYTANPQTAKVIYTDVDGNPVKTDTVNGVTDQTVDTNSTVPTGWKLVDGQKIPSTIKLGVDTPDMVVKIEHDHVSVSHDNPQTDGTQIPNGVAKFKGVSDSDLNQTLTRTITVNDPHEGVKTITQTAQIHRDAMVDMVDGSVVYGDWSTAEWSEYVVPTVDGYTPSQAAVEAKTVTDGTKDDNVTIDYIADKQTTHVVYVDENGNQIKSDVVDGHTDETVKIVSTVPAGWKLSDGQIVPIEITFKGAKTADVEVKVEHAHVTVTPDAPKTSVDKLPDNADKSYPGGVGYDDLNKAVKRTINVHNVDGTIAKVEQEVHFTRMADVDEADGTVLYGSWQADKQFEQYAVPSVPGYVSIINGKEQTMIQPAMPNVEDNDSTIDVTYQAIDGSQMIYYVDENGTIVGYQIITGKIAETKPVNSALPVGWKLVDGQTVPDTVTIKADAVPVKVLVEHDHVAVSHDNPQNDGIKIPNGASVFNGVTDNDLNQTLTRTIIINDPHTGVKMITQIAKIYRDAMVDMVDGSVVYGDWSTAQWPTYSVPIVDGYTASQKTVESKGVTDVTKDATVVIDYTANTQTMHIKYIDEQDNVVKTDTITGKTDETVKVNSVLPTGWKLVPGQKTAPKEIAFRGIQQADVTIQVEHAHILVTPDKPKTTANLLPDNPKQHYPSGVVENDLNRTVTRTTIFKLPNGQVKTITQTVTFTRTADVDEVTGMVLYGAWKKLTHESVQLDAPIVKGCKPVVKYVPNGAVSSVSDNTLIVEHYRLEKSAHQNGSQNPADANKQTTERSISLMSASTAGSGKKRLPQTGNAGHTESLLALGLLSMAALIGFDPKKQHKKHKRLTDD